MRPPVDYDQHSRYLENGGIYLRILKEAGHIARCSDNKTAALQRPIAYAIRRCYLRLNRPDVMSWLLFDLDHTNSLIWQTAGLPPPNIIVRDPRTGKSHLAYAIKPVLTGTGARAKPQQYMRAVYDAYCLALEADPSYRGPVFKTPGHCHWETVVLHEREYDLGELAEYVELEKKYGRRDRAPDSKHSRACILFDEVRFYAYDIVERERSQGSFERFTSLVAGFAAERNNFAGRAGFTENLRHSEVKATVKSVSRWTWDNYFDGGRRCRRGIMHLGDELSLKEKQRLAAQFTHDLRHQSSAAKILGACAILRGKSETLTLSAVAKAAGLARQTVAKYKHLLAPAETMPAQADLPPGAPAPSPSIEETAPAADTAPRQGAAGSAAPVRSLADAVNYAVCQISGALEAHGATEPYVVALRLHDG